MKKVTILEYSNLKDKTVYDTVLCHLKPCNSFANQSINFDTITYANFRKCIELLKTADNFKTTLKLFKTAFQFENDSLFWNENIDVYFSAKNYLIQSFEKKITTETNLLNSIDFDSELWKMAGGDSLNHFSVFLPLIQLAEIYHLYPFDLQHKPYNEIITLLVINKRKNEIQKKYNQLKNKTND